MLRLTQAQNAHILALQDASGKLTAAALVADARNKKSPIHDLFDWDPKRAIERDLLLQAREVIGAVRIVVTTDNTTVRAPYYVHVPGEGEGYRAVSSLRNDPAQARESLIYTLQITSGHLRRAMDLAGPLGLAGEVDLLLEQITGLQRIVREAAA
jgi:hypothetical protein